MRAMKPSAKIIVYCLWIGLLLWFSTFNNDFFLKFIGIIKTKVFGADVPSPIDFAISFIPWNCFISLLIWFPILFLKQRRLNAAREIAAGVIFFFFLVAINLSSIVIWDVFFPEFIGDSNGEPKFSVLQQYAVNDGWTPLQFKCVWWMYILITTAFSALMPFTIAQIKKEGIIRTLSS
jgi:hypothetical protein